MVYRIRLNKDIGKSSVLSSRSFLSKHGLEYDSQIIDTLKEILKPYSINPIEYLERVDKQIDFDNNYQTIYKIPWCFISFPREYNLFFYLKSLCTYGFGYSTRTGLDMNSKSPLVGFIQLYSKKSLAQLALKSPLFSTAYWDLKDKNAEEHWFCFPFAPPEEWLIYKEAIEKKYQKNLLYRQKKELISKPDGAICSICGKVISYDLIIYETHPQMCNECSQPIDYPGEDEIDTDTQDMIEYLFDHPKDKET